MATTHPQKDSDAQADERWMQCALALASRGRGRTRPNPAVGAVVLDRNGRIVGEGFHRRAGGPHAEIIALRKAGKRSVGGSIYVTLEPCCTSGQTGPCTDAIIAAGIRRTVVALRDPNPKHRGRGLRQLRAAGIHVTTGVCRAAATELVRSFAVWITQGRPHVTLKLGMTVDGRIADATGLSKWITSPQARKRVQQMRKVADAIMVGGETARLDNPSLLCPRRGAAGPPLLRVIVDDLGVLEPASRVLCDSCAGQTIVATTQQCPASRLQQYEQSGATVWVLPSGKSGVSLPHLMGCLGKHHVVDLLCEGGGQLAGSLVRAGLVDRFVLFYAPAVLGGDGRPAIGGRGWPLDKMPKLKFERAERVGADLMISAVPAVEKKVPCLPV